MSRFDGSQPLTSSDRCGRSARLVRDAAGVGFESLESRTVFAVAAVAAARPSIVMSAATDTGIRDSITFVTTPVFAGKATPGATVRVQEAGRLIGVATATRSGDWAVATPRNLAFAAGPHTVTATAVVPGRSASAATPYAFRIDTAAPTATLGFEASTGRAVLRFSRPVTGVSLAGMQLDGRTAAGFSFSTTLADQNLRQYVGGISMTVSADRKTYTFGTSTLLSEAGTFRLTVLTTPRIVDSVVGNPFVSKVSAQITVA